jgi:quercetin dioxygenase-like cupin family protein
MPNPPVVLGAEDLAARSWEPLRGMPGVSYTILWRLGDNLVGLIRVEPGAEKPAHSHHAAHHHIWVVSGSATMLGQRVSAGSYVYIPPGTDHEVVDVGASGVTFLYTHRPVEFGPDEDEDAVAPV